MKVKNNLLQTIGFVILMGIFSVAHAESYYKISAKGFGSSGFSETIHTFSLPSGKKPSGGGYLKIELTGDFDNSNEYAKIYIDGQYTWRAYGNGSNCQTSLTRNFHFTESQAKRWFADGKITVKVRNSRYVTGCSSSKRKHGLALKLYSVTGNKTLSRLKVTCSPTTVNERANGKCTARAYFSDNTNIDVTHSATWKKYSYISSLSRGKFTTTSVSRDTRARIYASYTYNGNRRGDSSYITIKNTDMAVTLKKIALSCPSSVDEGKSINCKVVRFLTNGSQSIVTSSSKLSVQRTSKASIDRYGKITTQQVGADTSFLVKAEYAYNGKKKEDYLSITIKDKAIQKTVKSLSLSCPSSLNERKIGHCTTKAFFSDNTSADVTRNSQWKTNNTSRATINRNGTLVAKAVEKNTSIVVTATYVYNGKSTLKSRSVTIKNVDPVVTPPVSSATVTFTNRWKNSKIKFNGNDEWIFKKAIGNSFSFCEKKRPTYCLNTVYGNLRSSKIAPENSRYAQWTLETVGAYKKIRNVARSSYYIHHERSTVQAGYIQSGWWSAMWKMEEVKTVVVPQDKVTSFNFLSKSNKAIKLTVGRNSDWVLKKDTIYGTDAYKICEKKRADYCLNIEHRDQLQNSKIKRGWYSALWTIEKLPDGSLVIRSKWKPSKFIAINSSGVTLTTDKNINTSRIEKSKSLLGSVVSLFISTANAEYVFGEALVNLINQLNDKEMWEIIEAPSKNTGCAGMCNTGGGEILTGDGSFSNPRIVSVKELDETVTCVGTKCTGLYPEKTQCFKDKSLLNYTFSGDTGIELWGSDECDTRWITTFSTTGDKNTYTGILKSYLNGVYYKTGVDEFTGNSVNSYGNLSYYHSPMIYSPNSCTVKAYGGNTKNDDYGVLYDLTNCKQCLGDECSSSQKSVANEIIPIAQYIIDEINNNLQSREFKDIKNKFDDIKNFENNGEGSCSSSLVATPCLGTLRIEALIIFGELVQQEGKWDHKPIIAKRFITKRGIKVSNYDGIYDVTAQHAHLIGKNYRNGEDIIYDYDIWSNVHYGYIGYAAGISETMLIDGSNMGQFMDTLSFDDAKDTNAIKIGIELRKANPSKANVYTLIDLLHANEKILNTRPYKYPGIR